MKAVYIIDSFPRITTTFILNEILEIQAKGVDVEVMAFEGSKENRVHPRVSEVKAISYFANDRVSPLKAHAHFFFRNPLRYINTLLLALNADHEIYSFFRRNLNYAYMVSRAKPNHIHAHFGKNASNLSMLVHLLTGIPYSFTTHRYDIFERPPKNYRIKSRLAKRHITISQYNKDYIVKEFNVEPRCIDIVHCGIDFTRIPVVSPNYASTRIISVARLEKFKGRDILIKACAELKKEGIQFECLIVGDGPEKEALDQLIKELGVGNEVKLYGNAIQDEVFKLMSESAIKVLSSYSEGIPVALMEAMAMNIPVIGPKITGVPELIEDGKEGFLVEPGDVKLLALRMKTLLLDQNLRRSFVQKAYVKVRALFDNKVETDKLLAIWKE